MAPPNQSPHDVYVGICESYSNHPEQGLKLCRKILQKNPSSTVHQLAHAWFLSELSRDREALDICETVDVKSPSWQEPELVAEYQELLLQCRRSLDIQPTDGNAKLLSLWRDQLDKHARLNGREVRSGMFRAAFANNQWEILQQLFAWLQKDFPKVPQYHFAWIALSQIQAEKPESDGKTGQYLRMLAYRSLGSAVTNTLENKENLRKVTTTQQLRLITYVYKQQNQIDELLTVLNNPTIGTHSNVGKGDTEFIRVQLDLMAQKEQWSNIVRYCSFHLQKLLAAHKETSSSGQSILESAWADDWTIWETYITATTKSGSEADGKTASSLIDAYLELNPKNRNAGRADLLSKSSSNEEELLNSCLRYWNVQCDRRACFEDLRRFISKLSEDRQRQLMATIDDLASHMQSINVKDDVETQSRQVSRDVNVLKLDYFLNISRLPHNAGVAHVVHTFVLRALKFYALCVQQSIADADDACILVVLALVRLSLIPDSIAKGNAGSALLLTAFCLVESLRAYSPKNYQADLLYVRISQLLGLYQPAAGAFDTTLKLKEVQRDTLGHMIYTRLSTLHPQADQKSKRRYEGADPMVGMQLALEWNAYASRNVVKLLSKDLQTLPYDKLPEFASFKEKIEKSFSRAMVLIEKRRAARLTGRPEELDELPVRLKDASSDNRDFSVFPEYEYGTTGFEQMTRLGNSPGLFWLARWTVNDLCQTLLVAKAPEALTRNIKESVVYMEGHGDAQTTEMTPAELLISEGWTILNRLICYLILGADSEFAAKDFKKETQALVKWMVPALTGEVLQPPPSSPILRWDYLHPRYLVLEFCKTIEGFTDACSKAAKAKAHAASSKIDPAAINDIRAAAQTAVEQVRKDSTAFAKQISKERWLEMADGGGEEAAGLTKAIVDCVGKKAWETSIGQAADAAAEPLAGLSLIKFNL